MKQIFKKQTGFTLLELMGVLLLISLGIFLVLRQQASAGVRADADAINKSLSFTAQKAPAIFTPTFGALTCPGLANNGAFSGTQFRVDRTVNPVQVFYSEDPASLIACAPATLATANDAYRITLPAMSNDLCSEVVTKLNPLVWTVTVNGTAVKAFRGALNPDTLGTTCTATATTDAQVVAVSFGRTSPPQ
jgi:hypothetical protein